jgi:hypothetical protein
LSRTLLGDMLGANCRTTAIVNCQAYMAIVSTDCSKQSTFQSGDSHSLISSSLLFYKHKGIHEPPEKCTTYVGCMCEYAKLNYVFRHTRYEVSNSKSLWMNLSLCFAMKKCISLISTPILTGEVQIPFGT